VNELVFGPDPLPSLPGNNPVTKGPTKVVNPPDDDPAPSILPAPSATTYVAGSLEPFTLFGGPTSVVATSTNGRITFVTVTSSGRVISPLLCFSLLLCFVCTILGAVRGI
jgi:hypothetical protein